MKDWEVEHERRQKVRAAADAERERFNACLLLAGFKVSRTHVMENGYHKWWSDCLVPPWYLFETDVGLLEVGWRKRVIHVGWESTGVRWTRPVDPDITRDDFLFHAWGYDKLLEYLKLLHPVLAAAKEEATFKATYLEDGK